MQLREVASLAQVTAPSAAECAEVPGLLPCPAASRPWPAVAWLPPAAEASQKNKTTPKLQPAAELPPGEGVLKAAWVQGVIAIAPTYLASKTLVEILTFWPPQSL